MGRKKGCRNLFETDLRKERAPFLDADLNRLTPDMGGGLGAMQSERLYPLCLSQLSDQASTPRMNRADSYRAPPLRISLETIQEDKPDYFQRSKSVPVQKRQLSLDNAGHGLHRLPSYRPGQCARYGVSMSDPMTFQGDTNFTSKPRRSGFSKMRDALRCARLREAFCKLLSKLRPSSRS